MRTATHTFNSETDIPFNKERYSRFKYGCPQSTFTMATELAEHLYHFLIIQGHINSMFYKEIVISGAPYNQVPVASTALAEYTAAHLTMLLGDDHPIKTFKVSRQHSYHDDYGSMNSEDRKKSISGETFYVDPNPLQGKLVIFIDDIYVTGAHESRVQNMMDNLGPQPINHMFAYYAKLENSECCPTIESTLNMAAISQDSEILAGFLHTLYIHDVQLLLNTRVVKFLLRLDPDQFKQQILDDNNINNQSLILLFKYACGNGYHQHEYYKTNFKQLTDKLNYNYGLKLRKTA